MVRQGLMSKCVVLVWIMLDAAGWPYGRETFVNKPLSCDVVIF